MDFIRRLLEQKVAAAIGMPVRMGMLNFSPLSGSVQITDLSVGSILQVKRIEAKISLARALKQELVIKSLNIESPLITLARPLPKPPSRPAGTDNSKWSFEAQQVLIVDGQISFRDPGGYALVMERMMATVKRKSASEFEFVFSAETSGRRDQMVELGQANGWGTIAGEAVDAHVQVGSILKLHAQSAAIRRGPWMATVEIVAALELILRLLPPQVVLPINGAEGEVTFSAAASADEQRHVTVDRFSVNTHSAQVKFDAGL